MKFLPGRDKFKSASGNTMKVADLDALLTKSISFKLHGKDHVIEPLSVEQFMHFASAYSGLISLQSKEVVTPDQLVDAYYDLIASVCSTVSKDDIRKMTQQQVSGLFQIMIDLQSGKIFADEKKTLEKVNFLINRTT